MKKDEKQNSIIEGVSLGTTFIIVGIMFFFIPDYFKSETATSVIAYILIFFGLFQVGTELNNLNGNTPRFGLDNFALGIAFVFLWIWLHSSYDNLLVNILSLFILIFGVYGTILGIMQFGSGIFQPDNKEKIPTKIVLTLINVITALAVIYEALQKFGIVESLVK